MRLDKYLSDFFPDISRTKIQKNINRGAVLVDGYLVKPSYKLKTNHIVTVEDFNLDNDRTSLKPQNIPLNIIYEDDQIIVVNKSSGIIVHPGIGNKESTMLNALLYHCSSLSNFSNRPGVIHRLDKETTGVIVFAKTDKAHYFISEQFANREILKQYKAIVWGNLNKEQLIEKYLKRDDKNRLRFKTSDSTGKKSITICKPIKNYSIPISIVDAYPKTGRTHQIRVHLSSIGHPILNDVLYNGSDKNINSFHEKDRKSLLNISKLINRVALHAYKIQFKHPTLSKTVSFEAPVPDDFKKIYQKLDEYK